MENQRLLEIRAEIARRKQAEQAANSSNASNSRLEEVRAEIARRKQSEDPEFNWGRFLGEQFSKGVLDLADFGEMIGTLGGLIGPNQPPISERTKTALKQAYDLDLDTQGKGNTPGQRIIGAGARSAPSGTIGGFPNLGKNLLTSAGIGSASQGMQEGGTPPLIADILSILGVSGGEGLLKKLLSPKAAPTLNEAETRVANAIKSQMTEDEINNVVKNIENYQPNKITGYDPLTAEVADSAGISQIHRVRQPVASSGIATQEGAEHNKVVQALQDRELSPISSGELQNELKEELAKRVKTRWDATNENYNEKIKKNLNYAIPENTEKALNDIIAKGSIKGDLNSIRKDIMPKPGHSAPTIAELWATKKALNSKISARKKAGMDANVTELKEVKDALLKDLAKDPLIQATDKLYSDLSIPIDEIKKHPKLKQLLKSRSNDIVSDLFDKNSHDNAIALKKALGSHTPVWSSIEDAVVQKFRKTISSASSKGASRELSFHKYSTFMEKHGSALKEIFTKDQMELLDEIGKILKGQNSANTKGSAKFSPTQANIRNEKDLKALLGITEEEMSGAIPQSIIRKLAQGTLNYIPKVGKMANKSIDVLIDSWAKHDEEKVMKLVDKFLKDKEFATKLLTYRDKPQIDLNRFLNSNLYKISATSSFKERNREKD